MREEYRNITLNGRPLNLACLYRQAGSDLLLFIHGLGCSKASFLSAFNRPELREFSLLALDLPGFGDSEKPEDFPYAIEDHAAACERLLGQYPAPRIHIAAHSMGGAVGLFLAEAVANRLLTFVNIEGNLIGEDCGRLSRLAAENNPETFYASPLLTRNNGVSGFLDLRKALPAALYRSARSLAAWSDSGALLDAFLRLRRRTHYIYGADNPPTAVLERLTGIPCAAIPASGHFPMNENPGEFYPKLAKILRNSARTTRI